jgi:hypothetical protein
MVGGRPGPAPQTAKREWFARLIAQACRIVGVNPRTGNRWRGGRTITSSSGRRLHYPPVISSRKREISPRYLSEERVRITDLRGRGLGCGRSRARWVIARRRSVGSCAVTATRAVGSTGRGGQVGGRCGVAPVRG